MDVKNWFETGLEVTKRKLNTGSGFPEGRLAGAWNPVWLFRHHILRSIVKNLTKTLYLTGQIIVFDPGGWEHQPPALQLGGKL